MKPLAVVLMMAGLVIPASAQSAEDEDGPGRGVARLSVLNGDVSIRRGDSGDLVAAALNAPLVVQDRVLTGPMSRAELQFDYSTMIRIGANAEVRLSELEYRRYQVQIALGTTTFRVLRDSDAQVELSTPSVSVRPLRRGVYRITVREDGSSEVIVRSGEAEVYTQRGSERLTAGRTMLARGTANDPEFQVVGAVEYDDWDRWNEARDRDLERSESYKYVSTDVYGAEDLDGYGTWVDSPSYGRVWRPVVVGDWAPYRHGRWVWVDFYGWTWVSSDPWGWAPYHYGRWFNDASIGWCWWPGQRHVRSYWSPALVAFFGWGGHGGGRVGVGFGNVGWVPLAPNERYNRWYGRGGNTTIINNTNIVNVYRNARGTNGVTAVNGDNFGRGHVTGNHIRVNQSDLERTNLVRGNMPVTPNRDSLRMADRQVRTADVTRTNDNQRFYSRRQPTAVDRVPFEQQRQQIEQVNRRTLGDTSTPRVVDTGRGSAPAVDTGRGGWRRAGEPARTNPDTPVVVQPQNQERRRSGDASQRTQGDSGTPAVAPAPPERTYRAPEPTVRTAQPENSGGNWRRFGEPTGDRGRTTAPAERTIERQPAPAPTPQFDRPSRQERRSYDDSSSARQERRSNDDSSSRRQEMRPQQDSNRGFGSARGNESAPMRINPPIVRERSAPAPAPAPRNESRPSNDGGNRESGDRGRRSR